MNDLRLYSALLGLSCTMLAGAAAADEVFLKNGDKLTGTIQSAADGTLVFSPSFSASTKLSIPMDQVATFSTTSPLAIELKNGTTLNRPAQTAAEGQVAISAGAGAPTQPLPLLDIVQINPEAVRWHGAVGANGLYGRSTTTTVQLGVNAEAIRRDEVGRITLSGAYNFGRQRVNGISQTNTDNWRLLAKYDAFFSDDFYGFASAAAESDRVNQLRLRASPSLGVGYQWVDRNDLHLRTEAGGSWLYEDYRSEPEVNRDLAMRLAYHVDKTLGGRISLVHNLEYLPSVNRFSDFLLNADAGMRVTLIGSMYSEVNAKLAYDNQPGLGARKATTELRLGVGMTY